jgi:hypothetical protein
MRKVRGEMGLTNVKLMVPFRRAVPVSRPREAAAAHGTGGAPPGGAGRVETAAQVELVVERPMRPASGGRINGGPTAAGGRS